ncbi:MAG: alanine racemase [Flavobacteriaceae bacterium]
MAKTQETVLEIDLTKLKHNYDFIKSQVNSNTKIIAVVKAFAYGSDAENIATYLQELNVDYFAVAYVNEGIALRKAGVHKPIIVLHPQQINFNLLIDHCLEPNLYNFNVLNEFIKTTSALKQRNYPIHIKFNTGLNRLGFTPEDTAKVIKLTNASNSIQVNSVCSHLAASEDSNEREFTLQQIATFKTIQSVFKAQSNYTPLYHLVNTSGILNYPEAHFDMVRTGIGLYGFGNSEQHDKHLQPIASLKSVISQIHHIKAGESLGYNRAFIAQKNTTTATIPIGHADGITRQYGNGKGVVYINNQKATIIGNVCMDMIMVDITSINCVEGDEVVIYNGKHTATDLAATGHSISYEIITATSQRIKRVFISK